MREGGRRSRQRGASKEETVALCPFEADKKGGRDRGRRTREPVGTVATRMDNDEVNVPCEPPPHCSSTFIPGAGR